MAVESGAVLGWLAGGNTFSGSGCCYGDGISVSKKSVLRNLALWKMETVMLN